MASLPASRLENIVMILMHRIGTRELILEGPEVLDLEAKYFISHKFDKITNRLFIWINARTNEDPN